MTSIPQHKLALAFELFEELLDVPPGDREQWLHEKCSDVEVKNGLWSWLNNLTNNKDHFGEYIGEAVPDLIRAFGEGGDLPEKIGAFRILDVVGRGGMGVVYRAARDDGAYDQHVALKLLPGGLSGDQGLRRFQQERQILARLNHPGIATLLDGGTTPEGQSYLVMELIEGKTLTTYTKHHNLNVEDLIVLLLQVIDAVSFAENKLIVHGDIKPNNVMVTDAGQTKLLDFGIARLLGAADGQESDTITRLYRPLTPGYAAPEQILGEPLTTATDVYQLGLLLYRLITGIDAQPIGKLDEKGIRALVCETSFVPTLEILRRQNSLAVTTTTTGQLRDIDAILGQALAKEPAARYRDAGDMGADLRRLLGGQAVHAVPPSWRYGLTKFVKRHAGLLAVATITFAAVTTFVILLLVQEQRVRAERDLVQLEASRASAVTDYLVDLISSANPGSLESSNNADTTVLQVIDASVERLRTELLNQPEVRGRLMVINGAVLQQRGEDSKALPVLQAGLEILTNADPVNTAEDRYSANYSLAAMAFRQGDALLGFQYLDDALSAYHDSPRLDPGLKARVLMRKGQYQLRFGDAETAQPLLQEAVAVYRGLLHTPPINKRESRQGMLAVGLAALAEVDFFAQRPSRALATFRQALVHSKASLGSFHNISIGVRHSIARQMLALGQLQNALVFQEETLALLRANYPLDTPSILIVYSVNRWLLAKIYNATKTPNEAIVVLGKALQNLSQVPGGNRFLPRIHYEYCRSYQLIGNVVGAREACAQALQYNQSFLGPEHLENATYQIGLADLQPASEQAKTLYAQALQLRTTHLPPTDWRVIQARLLVMLPLNPDADLQTLDRFHKLTAQLEQHEMYEAQQLATRVKMLNNLN